MQFHPITQGATVQSATGRGLTLTETLHPPNTRLTPHAHENAAFTFVVSGAFTESFGGYDYECRPAMVLFKPGGAVHSNAYHEPGARSFIVEFDARAMEALELFARFDELKACLGPGTASLMAQRAYDLFRSEDPGVSLDLEELIIELTQRAGVRLKARDDARAPAWLLDVKERIEAAFDMPLSLAELANESGVHPVYLARCFRRHYRCSIGEYIRRCRIDRAVESLVNTQDSAVRLALALGYCDQSHFTRAFKAETGTTPAAYRRRARLLSDR